MALRGVKPTKIEKRLKLFLFGPAGAGKTYLSVRFPKPYMIDTEKGAENNEYTKALNEGGGLYFHTTDFDDLMLEVKSLLTTKHEYKTLIIDSLTWIYADLCHQWAAKLAAKSTDKNSDGTEFQRHRDKADNQVRQLIKLLVRLDMNVIITAHQKVKWEKSGSEYKEAGTTFDCYKKMDYLFDLALEVQKAGDQPYARVVKTRIEGFKDGERFKLSYDEIVKKYGKDQLEKYAVPQELATTEQVTKLTQLTKFLKIPEEIIIKTLSKAESSNFDELKKEQAQAWIDALLKRMPSIDTIDNLQGELA